MKTRVSLKYFENDSRFQLTIPSNTENVGRAKNAKRTQTITDSDSLKILQKHVPIQQKDSRIFGPHRILSTEFS